MAKTSDDETSKADATDQQRGAKSKDKRFGLQDIKDDLKRSLSEGSKPEPAEPNSNSKQSPPAVSDPLGGEAVAQDDAAAQDDDAAPTGASTPDQTADAATAPPIVGYRSRRRAP